MTLVYKIPINFRRKCPHTQKTLHHNYSSQTVKLTVKKKRATFLEIHSTLKKMLQKRKVPRQINTQMASN